MVDLIPASSAYEVSRTSTFKLWRSQYRKYIRINISAQSAASTPPASDLIVTSASRSSYSPFKSVCTSNSLIAFLTESNSVPASASALSSPSALASSNKIGISSTRRRSPSRRPIVDCTRDNRLVIFCAFSGSSHKSGTPAAASSSIADARNLGRSNTFSIETRVASIAAISRSYSRAAMEVSLVDAQTHY